MKKFTLLFIALVATFSAKADLIVDSLGTVRMGRGIINVAELGLTDIENGHIDIATIDNANIENATSSKIDTDTIYAQYARLQHVHFGQTLTTSAFFQLLNATNASINNMEAIKSDIDSISTNYISATGTSGGVILNSLGLKNAQSNEFLYFEKDRGAFFYDSQIPGPEFHTSRRPYAFSIGTSRPNLYLHNYSHGANAATITAVVESSASILFNGYNAATNIHSCQIKADGSFYSRVGFITASDGCLKENVESVTNALDGIRDINPVSYNLKTDSSDPQTQRSGTNEPRTRYGFIAQELEEIFPNVIYTMPSGEKGIAYQELIPILVGAIQEQQEVIDNLADEIEALRQPTTEQRRQAPASVQDALADGSAMLMQNTPNPFNQATEIGYRLPEGAATALIMVCDMNGKMLQTYPLPVNTTAGTLTIQAGSYTPGMYLYTLLVDGAQIDTKQMIILAH